MDKASQVYKKIKKTPTSKAIDMLSDEWFFRKPPKGIRKEVNVVGRVKSAGLFDRIATKMDPHIWLQSGQKMNPTIREHILRTLYSFIPKKAIKQVVVIGSITGLQYNETSDVDVNAVLDPPELVEELWEVRRKHNEKLIPGTRHPLNIYLQPMREEIPGYQDSYFGVYDVLNDSWLIPPPDPETYRRPEDNFWAELVTARMLKNEFIRRADNYENSLKDKNMLKNKYSAWQELRLNNRIARDLAELFKIIEELQKERDFAYNWGWGVPRVGYRNIVYKFIHDMLPVKYKTILEEVEELKHKSKFDDVSTS
jgi:predicted nucleotidyltransferase